MVLTLSLAIHRFDIHRKSIHPVSTVCNNDHDGETGYRSLRKPFAI